MKARLYSHVWVIVYDGSYPYSLSRQVVAMKNKTAFITEEILDNPGLIEGAYVSYRFEDYGETWFKTFKEGKNYLLRGLRFAKDSWGNAIGIEINKTGKDFYHIEWSFSH